MNLLASFCFLAGDAALWFCCAAGVISVFTSVSNLTAAIPLMGLGCLLAELFRSRGALRFLGFLTVPAALALCRGVGDVLLILPASAYLGACVLRDRTEPDYNVLSYRFGGCTATAITGGMLCAWRGVTWGFAACLLYLSFSVFLLRLLRHGESRRRDPALLTAELTLLAGVAAGCWGLTRPAVLNAFLTTLKAAYEYLLIPVLTVLVYLVAGIAWLLLRAVSLLAGDGITQEEFQLDLGGMGLPEEMLEEASDNAGNPVFLQVLRAMGILAALFIAFLVFRTLFGAALRGGPAERNGDVRRRISPEQAQAFAAPAWADRSPAARIRRSYADYCRTLERTRRRLKPWEASREAAALALPLEDPAEAEALRRLYLRARYTSLGGLTRADAAEAARLTASLKRQLTRPEEAET